MSMKRVWVRGVVLNTRTRDMLYRAEARLDGQLRLLQGSYHSTVRQSGGTHNGGGALDASPTINGKYNPKAIVLALRESGFAAWHRLPNQGPWVEHVHAIAIGDPELSSAAAGQVRDYYNNDNGLIGNARDDGPRLAHIPVWYIKLPTYSYLRAVNQFRATKKQSRPVVKEIQYLLNRRYGEKLKVDGIAGEQTKAAFKRFQKRKKLQIQTGIPTPRSLNILFRGFAKVGP